MFKRFISFVATLVLGLLSMFVFSQITQASEITSEDSTFTFTNEDVVTTLVQGQDTVVVFPGDTRLILNGYQNSIEDLDITIHFRDEASSLLRSSTGYIYNFPGSIKASTSILGKNGPKSVYLERTKQKFADFKWRTAHYRGNIPKVNTQYVVNKWYSIYEGSLKFHYAS